MTSAPEATEAPEADVMRTVAEACELLGLAKPQFYEHLRAGEFSDITYPTPRGTGKRRGRRVRQSEIDAFIARNTHRVATP